MEAVLFVDDEEFVLRAIKRVFAEDENRIFLADNALEALRFFRENEIGVIVADNIMPWMSGLDLLSKVREISPDTTRILMTAYGDLPTAIESINKGEVFRFVAKPWDNEDLIKIIEDGSKRYQAIQTMKKGDEAVLKALGQTIELKDHYTKGHCDRVAAYALMIAEVMVSSEERKLEIKYGSWLHDCGKIGVPEAILNRKGSLDNDEYEIVKNHPIWGADVARRASLSDGIIKIILHHHERYDGKGYPSGLKGKDIPLEARIVAVADVFDALTTKRPYRQAYSWEEASNILTSMANQSLDPEALDVFKEVLAGIIKF